MRECPKCKKPLKDGVKFCSGCGSQIEQPPVEKPMPEATKFCSNCGETMKMEAVFCKKCGTNIAGVTQQNDTGTSNVNVSPVESAVPASEVKKAVPKKLLLGGAIGVVVIGAFLTGFLLFGKHIGSTGGYALYTEDRGLIFTDFSKNGTQRVTSRFIAEDDLDMYRGSNGYMDLGGAFMLGNDGRTMFYMERMNEESGAILYHRSAKNSQEDGTRIDTDVKAYTVNDTTTIVTYIVYESNSLYQYNIKKDEKEKIASDVKSFQVSADGSKIIYLDNKERVYLKKSGKDKEKVDGEISDISYLSDDFKTIFYTKKGSLYKKIEGQEAIKIIADVESVLAIYDSGEAYFLKNTSKEISLMDYVQDDMAEVDETLVPPTNPTAPERGQYATRADYNTAYSEYEKAYEEYEAAYEEYYEKSQRDVLRSELASQNMSQSGQVLCYYDGKTEKVITEDYAYDGNNQWSQGAPVITFEVYNHSALQKVKLSMIGDISDVEEMVNVALYSATEQYVAVADATTMLAQDEATSFVFDESGKGIYYLDNLSEDSGCGDLYKVTIVDGKMQKPELYANDVYPNLTLTADGQLLYYKDLRDNAGELYINKDKIDDDVYSTVRYDDKFKRVIYFTDWSVDRDYGTLKVYEGGKATKIADDANGYTITEDRALVYMYDYSEEYGTGEIFVYKNGKAEKLTSEATALVMFTRSKDRQENFKYIIGWGSIFQTNTI